MQSHKPIIICGPTASGKSALAIQLAQKINAVIINADSQQVYKEIPILSAQPSEKERNLVPHYLFGVIQGDEPFNTGIWLEKTIGELKNHKSAIIVGGTGLYLSALLHGLSPIPDIPENIREKVRSMGIPELIEQLSGHADGNPNRMRRNLEVKLATGKYIDEFHQNDNGHTFKPEDFIILNLNVSRETIYDNINRRFLSMLDNGAIEEVQSLLKYNYPPNLPIMKAVGVPEIKAYLEAKAAMSPRSGAPLEEQSDGQGAINKFVPRETMTTLAQQKSRNYAKRQMTWFRNQLPAHKIDVASFDEAINLIK